MKNLGFSNVGVQCLLVISFANIAFAGGPRGGASGGNRGGNASQQRSSNNTSAPATSRRQAPVTAQRPGVVSPKSNPGDGTVRLGIPRTGTARPAPTPTMPSPRTVSPTVGSSLGSTRTVVVNNTTITNNGRVGSRGYSGFLWGGGWYFGLSYYPAGWYYPGIVYPNYWYWNGFARYQYQYSPFASGSGIKFDLDEIAKADRKAVSAAAVYLPDGEGKQSLRGSVGDFSGGGHRALSLTPGTYDLTVVLTDGREIAISVGVQARHVTHVHLSFDEPAPEEKRSPQSATVAPPTTGAWQHLGKNNSGQSPLVPAAPPSTVQLPKTIEQ